MGDVTHPCRWTPAILDAITPVIAELGLPVHDPFAGTGERLSALCDELGVRFTGTELEPEFAVDPRVAAGDSTMPLTYPSGPYVIVTSPAYPNGMADHFKASDNSRRHTYRQALATTIGQDRPLHPNNMGRYGNRHRRSQHVEDTHFDLAARCVRWWPTHAVVNVKDVEADTYRVAVVDRWHELLRDAGYQIDQVIQVPVNGQRHGANRSARADHEAVIVGRRRCP